MNISYYTRDQASGELVRKEEDIDPASVKSFHIVNHIVRRKDGYIRRFYKYGRIVLNDLRLINDLDLTYIKELIVYARGGNFKKIKSPVIARKLTRHGMEERKAMDWTWERV